MLRAVLGTVMTSVGDVAVCKVQNPYLGAQAWELAYAAVVVDKAHKYDGPEVAMIVTVSDERHAPENHWMPFARTIKNVYAVEEFRVHGGPGARPAVQVGRFLYANEAFVRHSHSRSAAGGSWAKAVGGLVPEKTEKLDNDASLIEYSKEALAKLQGNSWWQPLVRDHHLTGEVDPDITE